MYTYIIYIMYNYVCMYFQQLLVWSFRNQSTLVLLIFWDYIFFKIVYKNIISIIQFNASPLIKNIHIFKNKHLLTPIFWTVVYVLHSFSLIDGKALDLNSRYSEINWTTFWCYRFFSKSTIMNRTGHLSIVKSSL